MIMLYACWLAVVLGAAALAAERALRAAGRAGRWPWLTALLASPLLALAQRAGLSPVRLPARIADGSIGAVATVWPAAQVAWVALSALLLVVFGAGIWRARRALRAWPSARVAGVTVRMTRGVGPATLGIFRPVILLPTWVLRLSARDRRLVLLHELEHARAGDVRLLAIAAATLVVMPWNPALWWQAARLHRAVELDCDGRVVRRSGDARRYARLLVDAAAIAGRVPLSLALGRPPLVERRVAALLRYRPSSPVPALAATVVTVACALATPSPSPARSEFHAVEQPMGIYEIRPAGEAGPPSPEIRATPAGVIRPSGRATYRAPAVREEPPSSSLATGGTIRRMER